MSKREGGFPRKLKIFKHERLEEGKVDFNQLKLSIKLSKATQQYATNTSQKKIGLLLNVKSGDVIQYYKSDNVSGNSVDPGEISTKKYKMML